MKWPGAHSEGESDLQKRNDELAERLRDAKQRRPIEPAGLGSALGNVVDFIQQGLTSLDNPLIDYGLQQLDLETQVNPGSRRQRPAADPLSGP